MRSLIAIICFFLGIASASGAQTCHVGCMVVYSVDLGDFIGEGRTCAEADSAASRQCHLLGGTTTSGSCAQTPDQAVYVRQCRKSLQESWLGEFAVTDAENSWAVGQEICQRYCRQYGEIGNGVQCSMGGVTCMRGTPR